MVNYNSQLAISICQLPQLYTNWMYEVQKLIGKKFIKNKPFYRVKWRGYPTEQSTWEKETTLKYVKDLIEQYERKHPQNDSAQGLSTEQDAPSQAGETDPRETNEPTNKEGPATDDSSVGNTGVEEGEKKNPLSSNLLKKMKFNFNEEELVSALKNSSQIQKATKTIAKKQNQEKKLKKLRKAKKDPKKHSHLIHQDRTDCLAGQKDIQEHDESQSLDKEQGEAVQSSAETPNFTRQESKSANRMRRSSKHKQSIRVQNGSRKLAQRKGETEPTHRKTKNLVQRKASPKENYSSPEQSERSQSPTKQSALQPREQRNSVQSLSSASQANELQSKLQESKGNLKIRLLDPESSHSEVRDYLVEDGQGRLKILSSIELLMAHPLEFIIYLQGRAFRHH